MSVLNSIDGMIDYFKNKAHVSFILDEYDNDILVNFNNFIKNGIIPNKEILDIVLSSKDTLDMLSGNNYIKLISKILEYKIIPDKESLFGLVNIHSWNYNQDLFTSIIELLIKHGLVINMDILKYVIKNGHLINNLERFDIEYYLDFYMKTFNIYQI